MRAAGRRPQVMGAALARLGCLVIATLVLGPLAGVPAAGAAPRGSRVAATANLTVYLPLVQASRSTRAHLLATVPAGSFRSVAYAANRVYGLLDREVYVVDVAKPHSPRQLASFHPPEGTYQLAATGRWLYALAPGRLTAYSIADSGRSQVVGSVTVDPRMAYGGDPTMALSGHYLLMAAVGLSGAAVMALDVLDPNLPAVGGTVDLAPLSAPVAAAAASDIAYVFDDAARLLRVFDFRQTEPAWLRSGELAMASLHGVSSLHLNGRYLYAWNGSTGQLLTVDVADPARPHLLGEAPPISASA